MLIVFALGGNAISRKGERGDIPDQIRNSRMTAEHIVDLVQDGHNVVVTHGNGPQVGNLLRRAEAASNFLYDLSLDICGAHTQGGMGYVLQREITNSFKNRGIDKIAITIITQCLVDINDPSFQKPTKPVGPFYTEKEAACMNEKGWVLVEDAGRGWRRVVPSPKPLKIIEERHIRKLIEFGDVIICCGGGGIPVVDKDGELKGVEGVIDKDFATSLLAVDIEADLLVITTNVEKVAINFNTIDEKYLDRMTISEAKKYYDDGEFADGSMGPKILSAINFVEATGNDTIITLPGKSIDAIGGKSGTRIVKNTIGG